MLGCRIGVLKFRCNKIPQFECNASVPWDDPRRIQFSYKQKVSEWIMM